MQDTTRHNRGLALFAVLADICASCALPTAEIKVMANPVTTA